MFDILLTVNSLCLGRIIACRVDHYIPIVSMANRTPRGTYELLGEQCECGDAAILSA